MVPRYLIEKLAEERTLKFVALGFPTAERVCRKSLRQVKGPNHCQDARETNSRPKESESACPKHLRGGYAMEDTWGVDTKEHERTTVNNRGVAPEKVDEERGDDTEDREGGDNGKEREEELRSSVNMDSFREDMW